MPNSPGLYWILRAVSVACLIVMLIPSFSERETLSERQMRVSLGLPFSPWLSYTSNTETVGARTSSSSLTWSLRNWSVAVLIAGYAADYGARRIRRRAQKQAGPA